MCNACHNVCCGSDLFGGCGCDGCDDPDCWSDEELDDEIDAFTEDDFRDVDCAAAPRPRFVCEAVS